MHVDFSPCKLDAISLFGIALTQIGATVCKSFFLCFQISQPATDYRCFHGSSARICIQHSGLFLTTLSPCNKICSFPHIICLAFIISFLNISFFPCGLPSMCSSGCILLRCKLITDHGFMISSFLNKYPSFSL